MKQQINENEIEINGILYVPKSQVVDKINTTTIEDEMKRPLVMIRTFSAGVHYGYLAKKEGKEVLLKNARRIWSWTGAMCLSDLSQSGTISPKTCKIAQEVSEITLTEAIEVIPITEKALNTFNSAPIWKS